jgi:ubiquinone/menaquinone biosynthesis C-methylase UbiE
VTDDAAQRARRTYDAAADHYDAEPLGFWQLVGTRTVERLELAGGERVLDAPCGSGASALAAAEAVGPGGRVVACDIAENLLALGRAKAAGRRNLEFRLADMRTLDFPDESFDTVVCVFGIFFIPDMVGQVRLFWRLLRPGGTLAVTTWGENMFAPGDGAFWSAVAGVRPDLVRRYNPWDALVTPEGVRRLFADAGIPDAVAEPEEYEQPLRSAEDWWTIVLGSGYRGTVDALEAFEQELVRERTVDAVKGVQAVRVPVVFGTARKPV